MINRITKASYNFRKVFPLVDKELLHWFPGHMNKGMKQMQQKLKSVDCIIEVHDARIPFSGRNRNFKHTISAIKPHILVLNKKDLTEASTQPKVIRKITEDEGVKHVVYTNCKHQKCKGLNMLTPLMESVIESSERFNRSEEKEYCVMIIGVPNVGKSSLINILRSRNIRGTRASPVGAVAGITRSVMTRIRISDEPRIYMMDTPGILEPSVKDNETGLKLALCSSLQDHLVGEEVIADYLLFWLNKEENFSYMDLMGLEEPSDDINKVLITGAAMNNLFRKTVLDGNKMNVPDVNMAAKLLIRAFRRGDFGKVCLDKKYIVNQSTRHDAMSEEYS